MFTNYFIANYYSSLFSALWDFAERFLFLGAGFKFFSCICAGSAEFLDLFFGPLESLPWTSERSRLSQKKDSPSCVFPPSNSSTHYSKHMLLLSGGWWISFPSLSCPHYVEKKIELRASWIEPYFHIFDNLTTPLPDRYRHTKYIPVMSYFKYDDKSPYIINNLNLNVKSGSKVGLMGRSGAGKSTLMKLLIRLPTYYLLLLQPQATSYKLEYK